MELKFVENYVVCKISFKEEFKLFVIDKEDIDKVVNTEKYLKNIENLDNVYSNWHFRSAGEYISKSVIVNGDKKELYLHNLIMNKLTFEGKGQTESIDHINRCGRDNRKENLRLITQSQQNKNQRKRKRKKTGRLVDRCKEFNINPEIVSTCIEYVYEKRKDKKGNITFREGFNLNLKVNGKRLPRIVLSKKCCICKKFPEKIQEAIKNFESFKKENPKYFVNNQEEYKKQINKFNGIIK